MNVIKRLTPGDGQFMSPEEVVLDLLFITLGLGAGHWLRRPPHE